MAEAITNIVSGSPERVAFDLATRIANTETVGTASYKREAMLKLYAECLRTVRTGEYEPIS